MKHGIIGAVVGIAISFIVYRCTSPQVEPVKPPQACKQGEWCDSYTDAVNRKFEEHKEILGQAKWDGLQKCSNSFLAFVKAITYAESHWNYLETYKENFTDATTKKPAVSVGLAQLSISDGIYYKQYSSCKEINETTLFYSLINLGCMVDILAHLTKKNNGHIMLAANQYWSVSRPTNKRHHVFLAKYLEECK